MPDNDEYQPTDKQMTFAQGIIDLAGIPQTKIDAMDMEAFLKGKTLDDPPTASAKALNTWVLDRVYAYSLQKDEVDEEIISRFQEDFENWTSEQFGRLNSDYRRALRKLLTSRGIYLGKQHSRINQRLEALVNEENLPIWDEGELKTHKSLHPDTLAYRHRNELLSGDRPRARQNDGQRQGENKRQPDGDDGRVQSD